MLVAPRVPLLPMAPLAWWLVCAPWCGCYTCDRRRVALMVLPPRTRAVALVRPG